MVKGGIEKEILLTKIELESEIEFAYYDWKQSKVNDFKQYIEDNTKIITVDNDDFNEVYVKFCKDNNI